MFYCLIKTKKIYRDKRQTKSGQIVQDDLYDCEWLNGETIRRNLLKFG